MNGTDFQKQIEATVTNGLGFYEAPGYEVTDEAALKRHLSSMGTRVFINELSSNSLLKDLVTLDFSPRPYKHRLEERWPDEYGMPDTLDTPFDTLLSDSAHWETSRHGATFRYPNITKKAE